MAPRPSFLDSPRHLDSNPHNLHRNVHKNSNHDFKKIWWRNPKQESLIRRFLDLGQLQTGQRIPTEGSLKSYSICLIRQEQLYILEIMDRKTPSRIAGDATSNLHTIKHTRQIVKIQRINQILLIILVKSPRIANLHNFFYATCPVFLHPCSKYVPMLVSNIKSAR